MNTLVIGGTGLISTAVTQQLLERGDAVTTLNRGITPARYSGDVTRLTGDRTRRKAFEDTIRRAGPWDCVIDMICADPEDAASLGRACHGAAGHVVFCSTTNVYPKPAIPTRFGKTIGLAPRSETASTKSRASAPIARPKRAGPFP